MHTSTSRNLIIASAAVLVALVVGVLPLGRQTTRAQTPTAGARRWPCLAVGSALGTAVIDPACESEGRRPLVHLAPTSRVPVAAPIVVPGSPSSLAASVSGRTVVLSWAAPTTGDPPSSYVVEAGSASGRSDLANTDTGSAWSALTATDVPPGSYFVRVRARSAGGTSAPSNEIVVTVQSGGCATAPGAPSALSAVVNSTTLTLTWQAPSAGCAATSYVIEAGSAPGLKNLAAFSTGSTATSFSATGVGSGTYYVRVRSVNAAGTSAPSNEVQFSVGSAPCQFRPEPPQGFRSNADGTAVSFSWSATLSGAVVVSYILEAGSAPGSSNLAVVDTGNAGRSLTATAAAGTYYVRLRARNACGTSAPSTEITLIVGATTPENVSILAADLGGNRLVRVTDLAGSNWETGPTGSGRSLNKPWHISLDSRARIYVADRDNMRIVRMDNVAGDGWTTFSGVGSNRLQNTISVNVDAAGRIYIIDQGSRVIRIDDMDGSGWTQLGPNPNGPGSLVNPKVLVFDAAGRMYVSDTDGNRIVRFNDMQGTGWVTYGSFGRGVGQFDRPEGLAVDALGRIYITDNFNHRIVRINDMTGAGWVSFGSFGAVDPETQTGAVGRFSEPHDIAISDSLRIYIADTTNSRIVRMDDMTGAGWTTFGGGENQHGCPPGTNCRPPGVFKFIAPKGIRLAPRS